MSELQDSKITLLQDDIVTLQSSLNQREKEVEKMREWVDKAPEGIRRDRHISLYLYITYSPVIYC